MAENPYKVLGVGRDAPDEEIRRAFRRLAKDSHPDMHPGDQAALERFRKVSAAYEIVGDSQKRRQFDRGEIDAKGDPQRTYQRHYAGADRGGGDSGLNDIFSDLFGQRGPRGPAAGFSLKGQDLRYTLEVGFIDLNVPEGVLDGQVLRLKGQGSPGIRGGESGDALVEIRVRPHAEFKRLGDDILSEIPITIDEAVLGGKIQVATATGRVTLSIPKGTSSGRAFRLKGKGIRVAGGQTQGDQIVTVRIVLPDTIDESLSYFLDEWRKKNAYDPGRKR
jgi:DnaJ-class molecular chaperone